MSLLLLQKRLLISFSFQDVLIVLISLIVCYVHQILQTRFFWFLKLQILDLNDECNFLSFEGMNHLKFLFFPKLYELYSPLVKVLNSLMNVESAFSFSLQKGISIIRSGFFSSNICVGKINVSN